MSANQPGQPIPERLSVEFSTDLPTPDVALAIGAHPDDVEFGCGATLAKWAAAGCTIHHLVCTDGSKGTWNPDADLSALTATRQDEQREAARRLAAERAGEVVFLGEVDGELESGTDERRLVAAAIRRLRPDVVLGHDPWKRYRLHPDHRHAGLLACDGLVAARDPHFFPELELAHHRPSALLLWEADEPNHAEDVEDFVDTKIRSLEAHASQFESTMGATDEAELETFRREVRERLARLGAMTGMPSAELFRRVHDI